MVVKVMSFNIRMDAYDDVDERDWSYRKMLVAKTIKKETPDVIGFQEVMPGPYEYLCQSLKGYGSIITYRDDSENPEGCPVFYREERYEVKDKGSFWLSETPEKMSRDWDSGCYRICSYVLLADKDSGKEFLVFNTHLDNASEEARIKGIRVVLDKIAEMGNVPAVLMGDFNAIEDSETYRSAMESFLDVKYQTERSMTGCTYQNWGQELENECIDYIMISKEGFCVNSYKIVTDTYDGVYPSDHFPIVTELDLE